MIRVIGLRRFLLLAFLGGFLVVLFLYGQYILQPELIQQQRRLSSNQSEVNEMKTNMDKLVKGISLFEEQKNKFNIVRQYGFFDQQNRVETRQRLNAMQKESRLLSAKYTIKQATTEESDIAKEAGYKILNTEISFVLASVEDLDIYNFIYLMNYGFPGQISIEELTISRDKEVTQPLLRQIGVGEAKPLVQANLKVSWRTMVVDESLSVSEQGGVR